MAASDTEALSSEKQSLLTSLGWSQISRRSPASVGTLEADIDTPALIVDLDIMDQNIEKLNSLLIAHPNVRPRLHGKAHKSPGIAQMQMKKHGAVGVCCQKLAEAEAMVAGGVSDVLISNEVVQRPKLKRLAELAKHASVSICADDIANVRDISGAASEAGVQIGLLVEVNVGQNRCGVETPSEAVTLAREIVSLPGLEFRGIQAYHGGIQHVRKREERCSAVEKVAAKAKEVVEALREAGLECPVVTGGGTGTFEFEAASGVYTEVQPGSYLFSDADYARNEDCPWQQSLFVQATVMSVNPSRGTAVIDAGLKASSFDSGPPLVAGPMGECFDVENGGDEHGILVPKSGVQGTVELPTVGEVLRLIPGHCDPTVNCHDFLVGVRKGRVEVVWEISGRGPGF